MDRAELPKNVSRRLVAAMLCLIGVSGVLQFIIWFRVLTALAAQVQ